MKLKPKSPLRSAVVYVSFGLLFMCCAIGVGIYSGIEFTAPSVKAPPVPVAADGENNTDKVSDEDVTESDPEAQKLPENTDTPLIMIDPGHGGEDGGAVSQSGLAEKELNLATSDDIAHLCLLFGIPYQMTREDDRLLYDLYSDHVDYTGKKKSLDLKNRLKLTEESGADLFVSIHMNKFTDPKYSGLQIYYSPNNETGKGLSEAVQSYVKSHLQKSNERLPKAATSSIFLLHHLDIPALLIECGFLSNQAEADALSTPEYRASTALTVFAPICEYFVRAEFTK